MGALDAIDGWAVPNAAAALMVLGDSGAVTTLTTHGDQSRSFPLASVTKLLTAYAVLVAAEEEVVGLDDAVPGLPGATLRHLLAHASGLGPDGRVLGPPGRRRVYSNSGFDRLGEIVAAAAAQPFADYVTEAVLRPLGMHGTAVHGSPASGATSTVDDLNRFAGELLAPRLLHPSTVQTATAVAFPGLPGVLPGFGPQATNDWGLGFELRDHKDPHWTGRRNSPTTFGHFGQSGTFLWVDPEAGRSLVVLTDLAFGPWAATAWPALSDAALAA